MSSDSDEYSDDVIDAMDDDWGCEEDDVGGEGAADAVVEEGADAAGVSRGRAAAWRNGALTSLELDLHAERGALVDELERKVVGYRASLPAGAVDAFGALGTRDAAANALIMLLPVLENRMGKLDAGQQKEFVHALQWTVYGPNERIYIHGEVGESCAFVVDGTLLVRAEPWHAAAAGTAAAVEGAGAQDYTRLYPGHHVGETSLLVSGKTRNASVLAGDHGACVLMLNRVPFEALLESAPVFKKTLEEMVKRVKQLQDARKKAKGAQTLARLIYVAREKAHTTTRSADTKKSSSSSSPGAASPPPPPSSGASASAGDDSFAEQMRVENVKKAAAKGLGQGMVARINDYDVLNEIGKGAYGRVYICQKPRRAGGGGTVYKGRDPAFEQFALKVVDKAEKQRQRLDAKKKRGSVTQAANVVETSQALKREIKVMSQLTQFSHPNICNLVEIIDADDTPQMYLVEDFAECGALLPEDEVTEPLEEELCRAFIRDTLQGLKYLHFQQIVHRDIKPSNILISVALSGTEVPTAMLGDLGSAGIISADIDGCSPLDVLAGSEGTPAYMAPEVLGVIQPEMWEGYEYQGFEADMFSLGATLYQMAYGALPHMPESGSQMDFFREKKKEAPFPTKAYQNPHLRHLCARLMAVLPSERLTLDEVRRRFSLSRFVGSSPPPSATLPISTTRGNLFFPTSRVCLPPPPSSGNEARICDVGRIGSNGGGGVCARGRIGWWCFERCTGDQWAPCQRCSRREASQGAAVRCTKGPRC